MRPKITVLRRKYSINGNKDKMPEEISNLIGKAEAISLSRKVSKFHMQPNLGHQS